MKSIKELRKIDPAVENLTDSELEDLRRAFYELGELIFEDWCEKKFDTRFLSEITLHNFTNKDDN